MSTELSTERIAELRVLKSRAQRVNGTTPLDHPDRRASLEYAQRIADAVAEGVSFYRLARYLNCTHQALMFRLGRHGFRDLPPSLAHTAYRGVHRWPAA